MRRDVRRIHRALLAQGRISLLAQTGAQPVATPADVKDVNDALMRSAQRVRALLARAPSAG
jgi:hypothetical protein